MEESGNNAEEITRLKGELSAATRICSILIQVASRGDVTALTTFQNKIRDGSIDLSSGAIASDHHWREGVDRFTERLLKSFPSNE